MKPIIYVYGDQLRELISRQVDLVKGIAFEWKNEDVYHVYTSFPKVAPVGYRALVFFKILKDKELFDSAPRSFNSFANGLFTGDIDNNTPVVGIFLYFDGTKLFRSAYRGLGNSIEESSITFMPEKTELYSRTKGLIEIDILENKNVLIIGLGSFGSHIAVELAKSGVGNFILVDFDRVELSNISRHTSSIYDLGRFKTFAVRDSILVKNPFAKIETYEDDINQNRELLIELIGKTDIVICATDNNRSRFNINEVAYCQDKAVLFGRAITRAEGGDVFKLRGKKSPCYCCLIGEDGNSMYGGEQEISSIRQASEMLPGYTTETEKNAVVQVGLSSDILPMCNLIVKLTLLELSRGLKSGINSLEQELTYNYYFWANRRENKYLNYEAFNNSKGKPTILKWFGVDVPANEQCFICSINDNQ
jgi:molybdopterin/thiamine biosynthesis adenylyltransferase